MKSRLHTLIACLTLPWSAQADMGRWCEPRTLSSAEKQAGERVAERLRNSLPSAPQGWAIASERTDIAAGSCKAEATGKLVAQPVSIILTRSFMSSDPSAAAAVPAQSVPTRTAASPEARARAAELERSIAELKRREAEAVAAYQAARRGGDSAAQREATQASRQSRAEMAPLQQELMDLRRAESGRRGADSEARTRATQERMAQVRANRRDASVSIYVNAGQRQMQGAQPTTVNGAPRAFRDRSGATHLLFGDWRQSGSFAVATLEESGSTTRVQNIVMRIDGSEPVAAVLLRTSDLGAIGELVKAGR